MQTIAPAPSLLTRQSLFFRAACAVALVVAEAVVLSLIFDFGSLIGGTEWWVRLFLQAPALLRVALTTACAAALFCGREVFDECGSVPRTGAGFGRAAGFLVGHFLAVGSVAGLTALLLSPEARMANWALLALGAWCSATVAAGVTLGLVVLPAAAWGRLVRRCWPSLVVAVLVGVVAWGGGLFSARMWEPLSRSTLVLVRSMLGLVSAEVVCEPEAAIIGTSKFRVEIAPQCSGYEGVGLIVALVGGYLWVRRRELRFPNALFLLPLGAALVWLANAVRITALILIGAWISPDVAAGGFHSQAGWLTFNAIALGLIAVSHYSSIFDKRPSDAGSRTAKTPNPAAPLLVPLLVIVGCAMVTAAMSPGGLDRLYAVRVGVAALVLWAYRRHYAGLGWSWSWTAVGVGVAVFGVWIGLESLLPPAEIEASDPFALPAVERWLWLGCRVVGAVVLVPIAEELAFRAYLLRRLQGAELQDDMTGRWNWFAVVASSVLFGLLHSDRWVAGTLAGVFFAWVFYRRGRLSDAILAHAVTNAILAGYVLATGRWELW